MKIKEKELYKSSTYVAQRYYHIYKREFFQKGFDLDDVMQEAKIVVFEMYNKYKDKTFTELKKICNQAIGWELNMLLKTKTPFILTFEEEIYVPPKMLGKKPSLLFEVLKQHCSEKEYNILFKKFQEDKTNETIGTELDIRRIPPWQQVRL